MSQFGGVNETLTLTIERLERLHEVCERPSLRICTDLLVDGQNLLELVLLLAYPYVIAVLINRLFDKGKRN